MTAVEPTEPPAPADARRPAVRNAGRQFALTSLVVLALGVLVAALAWLGAGESVTALVAVGGTAGCLWLAVARHGVLSVPVATMLFWVAAAIAFIMTR